MKKLGIIGGTTFQQLENFDEVTQLPEIDTPFGTPSSPLVSAISNDIELIFLNRHGVGHTIAPHCINYRANIYALHMQGVEYVLSIATVGGISRNMEPGTLCIPDQIIDYTYNRANTFYEKDFTVDKHLEFTYPYSESARNILTSSALNANIEVINGGIYAATQGPRLETAAEIKRLKQDGCDIVGMTGMPEAGLARELNMHYACCAVVVNWAAGISDEKISLEVIKKYANFSAKAIHDILLSIESF